MSRIIDRLRAFDPERALGLRPACPPIALALEGGEASLVRLRRKGRGRPLLEGHFVQRSEDSSVPLTLFDDNSVSVAKLGGRFRELFESTGVRPGRLALVLPDNLAKVALLQLPERPPSNRQLVEIIRFKLHRAVPFRLTEATLAYQLLPGEGRGVTVLVALVRQALVEKYEQALEAVGARPGLIDLCTPNLLNLCRAQLAEAGGAEGDVALLNCTSGYFTLVIVRAGRLIFFRCKSWGANGSGAARADGLLAREMASSLSYYKEKLAGRGIAALLVRSTAIEFDALSDRLAPLEVGAIRPVDPAAALVLPDGLRLEADVAQRIAPAVGAAAGRS